MSDQIVQVVRLEGQDQASATIREADASFKKLIATMKETDAAMRATGKAWAASLDRMATEAKEATTSAIRSVERMRGAVTAEADAIRASAAATFAPLSESAATATALAGREMAELRTKIRADLDTLHVGLADTFAPIGTSMATAATAVTEGATTMRTALDGVLAQAQALSAELQTLRTPAASGNAGIARAASRGRGHGGAHAVIRAGERGIDAVSGFLPFALTPGTAALGVLASSAYEGVTQQHEAARALLTGGFDPKQSLGVQVAELQRHIQDQSSNVNQSFTDTADAYVRGGRMMQSLDPKQRLGVTDTILPNASYEATMKGTSLGESVQSMLELRDQMGLYDADSIKRLTGQFAVASLNSNATLPTLTNQASYFLPQLRSSLGLDFGSGISAEVTAMNAGLMRSGTSIRDYTESLFMKQGRGSKDHNEALARLGLADPKAWQVRGKDGKVDYAASWAKAGEIEEKALAGLDDTTRIDLQRRAHGQQGGRYAALLTTQSYRDQLLGLKDRVVAGAGDGDMMGQLRAADPIQQFKQTWTDLKNVLADIGTVVLPPVVLALKGLDTSFQAIHHTFEALSDLITRWTGGRDGLEPGKSAKNTPDTPLPPGRNMGLMKKMADTQWDDDGAAGGGGMRTALTIWAQQSLDLAEIKKAITGPQLATLKAIETDLQTMGAGIAAALAQAMGGIGGTAGAIQASFETGGGSSGGAGASVGFALFGGKASPGRWWTPDRMQHAKSRLMAEAGLSDAGAEALVARWSSVEASGGPMSVNPKSGAAGIGQWLGKRRHGFGGDFDSQIGHAVVELNGSEKRAGGMLRRAQTGAQGAIGASAYERAEHYNARTGVDAYTGRTITAAKAVHDAIRNTASAPRITAPPATSAEDSAAQARGVTSRGAVHHHHGDIVVQGSGDPDAVASRVFASMDRTINRASHDIYFDV